MSVFFNDTATTEIYPFSLHDALPISVVCATVWSMGETPPMRTTTGSAPKETALSFRSTAVVQFSGAAATSSPVAPVRSEEHTSELQSRQYLVCRLLLEKKKQRKYK